MTCSILTQQESVSKQAYTAAIIAWSQGRGSSCQMPCQTTSLTLKRLYEADILSNYSDCLRYYGSCNVIHFDSVLIPDGGRRENIYFCYNKNIHVFISIKLGKIKPNMKKERNTTFTKLPIIFRLLEKGADIKCYQITMSTCTVAI